MCHSLLCHCANITIFFHISNPHHLSKNMIWRKHTHQSINNISPPCLFSYCPPISFSLRLHPSSFFSTPHTAAPVSITQREGRMRNASNSDSRPLKTDLWQDPGRSEWVPTKYGLCWNLLYQTHMISKYLFGIWVLR